MLLHLFANKQYADLQYCIYNIYLICKTVFGLDNDLTSNTTRSLDLESLLGGAWGTAQSVSDSETDTQGIRHIRSQLEGLEHM